jgi:hypothetical protein
MRRAKLCLINKADCNLTSMGLKREPLHSPFNLHGVIIMTKIKRFRIVAGLMLGVVLTACGGGGGSPTGQTETPSSIPLQVALKNIYANNWSRSGTISGTYTVPGGCYGSFCTYSTSGTFTRTTTLNGFTSTVNYAEVIGGTGLNKSYTAQFSPDYSQIAFGSCILTLPPTVSIGYTQVGACSPAVSLTVTAPTNGGPAILTLSSQLGAEKYSVESNGAVTPTSVAQSGTLFNDYRSYSLSLTY